MSAQGLGKRYPGGFDAVKGVDFAIEAGEFVAVVGRSGSGKSTLLAMLGGLMRPTTGRIVMDDRDVGSMDEAQLAEFRSRRIGFVFQFASLLPNLTALDNVALPALLAKTMSEAAARERAFELLRSVGLADRALAFPGTLSGGEQRRVAIARALVNSPSVLLADEPTSDLDEATEAQVIALLERMRVERGFALLVVSHDRAIAARADRVLEMTQGSLAPAEIVKRAMPVSHAANDSPIEPTPEAARLGDRFWSQARALGFACAVAVSVILLADSLVGRYQQSVARERMEKLVALETLALSSLRANVKTIASLGDARYELTLELWNVAGERPIYVMSPSVRVYVQVGAQWVETAMEPVAESTASVLKITGRQAYRYVFRADTKDYAKLFSHYMHVRFVNTMLVSPNSVASEELFERTDSYYVYLKPSHVADSEIAQTVKFDGAPPLWIAMPPH